MSLSVEIRKNLGDFALDVSFKSDGGVLGLLGASGCGKSMTLKCIAGVVRPDSGRIVLNDTVLFDSEKKINLPPQKRRLGYLFQSYALFPNMTVRDNILCGLHGEKDKDKKRDTLNEMLELLQLGGLEKHRPAQLSGGQQQRVALARILVGSPELLMLDEPFSALDSHLRGQLQIEMQKILMRFGKDSLLVTHSRDEAYHLCPQIALIENGRLLVQKETKALFIDPGSRQAAILTGCKNVVDAQKSGEYEVYVPDWDVRLQTAQPVRDGLSAVAIRAHYFHPKATQNRYPVRFIDEMEGPFEYILQFRYQQQSDDSPAIWWRIPKEKRSRHGLSELGIAPANVLLLYD